MNAAFNVTAKYNTVLISPENEPQCEGFNEGGKKGKWTEWRDRERMGMGCGLGHCKIGMLSLPVQ